MNLAKLTQKTCTNRLNSIIGFFYENGFKNLKEQRKLTEFYTIQLHTKLIHISEI